MDVVVSIEDVCGCCTPVAQKCFQSWTAVYDCEEETWTLTPGAKLCLPVGTSTLWTGTACSWQRYVAMDVDCTLNADCAGLANTAQPAPPFAGEPPSCCPCLGECGCRNVGRTATVTFAGTEVLPCTLCGATWYKGTTTLGTYTLTKGAGCSFTGIATGVLLKSAPDGGVGCPPDENFSVAESDANIELSFDPLTGRWGIIVFADDFQFFLGDVDQGDCTGPLVIDNDYVAYDPCGDFIVMINGTATVTFTPCVPV